MKLIEEFKAFVQRGNVIDLAVGLIMGGAFGKIVSSLVNDVLMPPIGYLINGVNFSELVFELPKKKISVPNLTSGEVIVKEIGPATIKYGAFLQNCLDFLIISFCVFLLVKVVVAMQKKKDAAPAAPPEPTSTEKLLTEIRDTLKAR